MKAVHTWIMSVAFLSLALWSPSPAVAAGEDDVDCKDAQDYKMHGRSAKSYWGVAKKETPPDTLVLAKARTQAALALCGIPDHWEWNMFMGMIKCELRDYEGVGEYFERAYKNAESDKDREKVSDNQAHYWVKLYNEGIDFFKEGAYALAAEQAELALMIDPDECRGHALAGPCFVNLGEFDKAVAILEEGHSVCPDNENLTENLFAAYHNRANEIFNGVSGTDEEKLAGYQSAAAFYAKAADILPDDLANLYQLGAAHLQAARAGDTTGVDAARQGFTRFLELSEEPSDKGLALYNLTLLEIEYGDVEAAGQLADQYLSAAPLDSDAYALKSRVLMDSGRNEEVEPYVLMTKCLKPDPVSDPAAWSKEAVTRYGKSADYSKLVAKAGTPQEIRLDVDSKGTEWLVALYPDKAYAFYAGGKKGEFEIGGTPAPSP